MGYFSSSGCSSLGKDEKSGELWREETVGWKGPPEEEEEEEEEAEVKLVTPFPLLNFLPLWLRLWLEDFFPLASLLPSEGSRALPSW